MSDERQPAAPADNPDPDELGEILADLEFFLEMEEAETVPLDRQTGLREGADDE
ncbi:MAG: hypothetical protein Kow0092_33670 [Deferrisomatales bacterium]